MKGLPNELAGYMMTMMLICLPSSFFAPAFSRIFRRKGRRQFTKLSFYHRCLCVLLAYVMLISPAGFESIAQASSQYSQISTANWATHTRIEYTYDDNGSCVTRTTKDSSSNTVESITYEYNLQNKLERVTKEYQDGDNNIDEVTEYTYNDDGIRVKTYYYKTVNGGSRQSEETKTFLIDSDNHTGYAQVLEETVGSSRTTYTIGDDVITQASSAGVRHLIYDGQGSTRQLTDSTGALVTNQSFSYDAYGVLIGFGTATPQTNLLYTGEYFDTNLQQYNLRARYYNPLNGRFNQMDSFAGNMQDPQSLHKYLYCHADPVNKLDPSGMFISPGILNLILAVGVVQAAKILIGIRATYTLGAGYIAEDGSGHDVDINRWIGRLDDEGMSIIGWIDRFKNRPDILDKTVHTIYEVKPDNRAQILAGMAQISDYLGILKVRYPGESFAPGPWQPKRMYYTLIGLPGLKAAPNVRISARNAGGGVIAYTINDDDLRTVVAVLLIVATARLVTLAIQADMARARMMPGLVTCTATFGKGLI
jgi:RHS repeat-associated protein